MFCRTCPAYESVPEKLIEQGGKGQCKLEPAAVRKGADDWCMRHPERSMKAPVAHAKPEAERRAAS